MDSAGAATQEYVPALRPYISTPLNVRHCTNQSLLLLWMKNQLLLFVHLPILFCGHTTYAPPVPGY